MADKLVITRQHVSACRKALRDIETTTNAYLHLARGITLSGEDDYHEYTGEIHDILLMLTQEIVSIE